MDKFSRWKGVRLSFLLGDDSHSKSVGSISNGDVNARSAMFATWTDSGLIHIDIFSRRWICSTVAAEFLYRCVSVSFNTQHSIGRLEGTL